MNSIGKGMTNINEQFAGNENIQFDLATHHNSSPNYTLFIVTVGDCVPSKCHPLNVQV
jgi:hypothetical protein